MESHSDLDDSHIKAKRENYNYDADGSNDDSNDMILSSSHDDSDHNQSHESQISGVHLNIDNSIGPKAIGQFIPISEDTIFMDSGEQSVSIVPEILNSSPVSGDSWMNYSSNSSEDSSCPVQRISTQPNVPLMNVSDAGITNISSSDIDDENSSSGSSQPHKNKRLDKSDDDSDLASKLQSISTVTPNSVSTASITRRQRGKDKKIVCLPKQPVTSPTKGKNAYETIGSGTISSNRLNSNKSRPLVDIRMIDFAHTTFSHNTDANEATTGLSSTVLHHGPDGGFLTGLASLQRLLTQILTEDCKA